MNRRTAVCLTFLTLFLFSSSSLVTPFAGPLLTAEAGTNVDQSSADFSSAPMMPPLPEGPSWDGSEYLYSGLGQILNTQEYSYGNKSSSVTGLTYNTPVYRGISLPQGWSAYQMDTYVYNLFDNITHIDGNTVGNGNFELGSSAPTGWSYDGNLGAVNSNSSTDPRQYYDWGSSYGRTGK